MKRNPPTSEEGRKVQALVGQAVDSATTIFELIGDAVVGIASLFAIALLAEKHNKWKNVEPESSEGNHPDNLGSPTSTEQNVMFSDAHPGFTQSVANDVDVVRDQPLLSDATLDEFFSRPIKIKTFTWGVGNDFFETFDPWSLYFEDPRVINRISNYKLMRAKMCVKFVINGNAFHYGRLLASYNPLHTQDQFTVIRQFFDQDLVLATQRPHIFLDPTNSQGGDMELPFFTYFNLWDITNQDWQTMGEINLKSFSILKHANGATDTVSVNVFACAMDVKFAIPTQVNPGSIVPQADEHAAKPVSRIAGAVAAASKALSNIPYISPFAKATEIGARAVGAIATLFGYSKPVMLEVVPYIPRVKNNLAVTNTPEDIFKLSVDAKQELTIDPRTTGLSGDDEMAINNIASRESYLTQFTWAVGTISEEQLFQSIVDPMLFRAGPGGSTTEYYFPAMAFATVPFKYWRGTIKFRFQVICSKYHKGRMKVVYDPSGNTTGSAEYNTAYTTVIDISDTTDFSIDCGWGQNTTYREHIGFDPVVTAFSDVGPLTYNSASVPYGNGTIALYVVNELTVPNTTTNNDIFVNVFVSACDDFEVAAPTNEYVGRLGYTPEPDPPPNPTSTLSEEDPVRPQAGEEEDIIPSDSKPTRPDTLNTMASMNPTADYANMIHFGERISSMRQLVKRYTFHEVIASTDATAQTAAAIFAVRNNFPYMFGWQPSNTEANQIVWPVGTEKFALAKPLFLQYLTLAYAGWRGGLRYIIDGSTNAFEFTLAVDRSQNPDFPDNFYNAYGDLSTFNGLKSFYDSNYVTTDGVAGKAIASQTVNGTISFEVPYYNRFRFAPAKRFTRFQTDPGSRPDPFQGSWVLNATQNIPNKDSSLQVYVSGAEDFNTFFYLGPPRLYLFTEYPTV
jgi:hypothetical protein